MSHTITYNSDLHILEIIYQGNIVFNEIKETQSEAAPIAKEKNCFLFLSDFRQATIKLSTMDLYELPKLMSNTFALSEIPVYKLKRAIIVAKDLDDYNFFETVTANRGQNAKIFQNAAEAKEWLSNK